MPASVDPDRVVVEVPHLGRAVSPWRWFGIDLDHLDDAALRRGLSCGPAIAGARVIARTGHGRLPPIADHLARPRTLNLTHLQFEARDPEVAKRVATLITDAGLTPLPAAHLPQPPSGVDDLRRHVDLLASLQAPLITLAYPAPALFQVHAGITLLKSFDAPGIDLALIPMGSLAGLAAAYEAGSRLIWAPPHAEDDRWGADQLLPRLTHP